ncbi:hypothetical protein MtrunA17_Chr3g0098861 [Medicago truncatula]|uniref:Uncharacterized protein n=1 Tax=Medicago truncatula TaxID=3880 RepID=A0A396IRH0_MEDTR|nr:hypothetical protein MtrunA17_Chr3g0098861 [Medicago truncatula]
MKFNQVQGCSEVQVSKISEVIRSHYYGSSIGPKLVPLSTPLCPLCSTTLLIASLRFLSSPQ